MAKTTARCNQPYYKEYVRRNVRPSFGSRSIVRCMYHGAVGLGITQVVVGALCICINILAMTMPGTLIGKNVEYGIWNGVFFILTGSSGIGAGCAKNSCMITSYMVMCIISASLFSPSLMITAGADVYLTFKKFKNNEQNDVSKVAPVALLVLGLLQFLLDIAGAVICCQAVCCHQQQIRGGVVYPAATDVQYENTTSQQPQPYVNYAQAPNTGGEIYPQQPQAYGAAPYTAPMTSGVQQPHTAWDPPPYTPTPQPEKY